MIASAETINVGNRIIFLHDEYGDGNEYDFDGTVQLIDEMGVHVVYLSGYRSRNDFILWENILAKVDRRRKWVKLALSTCSGHFLEFGEE